MDNTTADDRYPGYNVLDKRFSQSWDAVTRRVIDQRMSVPREPRFFSAEEWLTLDALCKRIVPQPARPDCVPLAAMLDATLHANQTQGFRIDPLPYDRPAWKQGLAALNASAESITGAAFHLLDAAGQDALLTRAQNGDMHHPAWDPMSAELFFSKRILVDIPAMYYAHPTAWNEIGFGGPASPRGYVRMELNRRDPWEAIEAYGGKDRRVGEENRHVG